MGSAIPNCLAGPGWDCLPSPLALLGLILRGHHGGASPGAHGAALDGPIHPTASTGMLDVASLEPL